MDWWSTSNYSWWFNVSKSSTSINIYTKFINKKISGSSSRFYSFIPTCAFSLYIFISWSTESLSLCTSKLIVFVFLLSNSFFLLIGRLVGIGNFYLNLIKSGCQNVFVLVGHLNKVHHPMKVMFGNVFIHLIFKHYKQCLFE